MPDKDEALKLALGQEIRAWRLRRKLGREELAAMAGISETTMGRIERSGPVDVGDTWRIAEALGLSFADLVRRAEEVVQLSEDADSLGAVANEGQIEGPGEDSI